MDNEKILNFIKKIEKNYSKNFKAQAEFLKNITNKAMQSNKPIEGIYENSHQDPFSFILDYLGRGDASRREIAKNICKDNKDKDIDIDIDQIPFLGIQNLTRSKKSHLKKKCENCENCEKCEKNEDCNIQECLKSIFWDTSNNNLQNIVIHDNEENFSNLQKIFKTPTSTVTSVLYWLYPEDFIPYDENSKALYKKLDLKDDDNTIEIKNDWESYNKVKQALLKSDDFKDNNNTPKFKPSMIIALSEFAYRMQNSVARILDNLTDSNNKPKNIILTGIPGTGKTYSVMEYLKHNFTKDKYEFVQFHPSYDYEDFIEGFKPVASNNGQIEFKLVDGPFKKLCKRAFNDKDNTYVMVIDEINRANLSRVFGELLYCLEYRGEFVSTKMTSYIESLDTRKRKKFSINEKNIGKFTIPENVIVLGTMNEVDRSIDAFDLALRRRFIWEEIGFDEEVLKRKLLECDKLCTKNRDSFLEITKKLNKKLSEDIGKNYQLGHTYFFKLADYMKTKSSYNTAKKNLWNYHLKSIIKEYCKVKYAENEIENQLKSYKDIIIPNDKDTNGK
jgi:5-methylcytosine-specific restriction protein B